MPTFELKWCNVSAHAQELPNGLFAPTVTVMQYFESHNEYTPIPISQNLTFSARKGAELAAIVIGEKWVYDHVR